MEAELHRVATRVPETCEAFLGWACARGRGEAGFYSQTAAGGQVDRESFYVFGEKRVLSLERGSSAPPHELYILSVREPHACEGRGQGSPSPPLSLFP